MSASVHTALALGKGYLTREIVINFKRPVFEQTGELMAEGRIVSIDGVMAMAAGRIIAADDRIYATGRAKCAIFDVKRVPSEDS